MNVTAKEQKIKFEKGTLTVTELTLCGVFAALVFLLTRYIQVQIIPAKGGLVHLGNVPMFFAAAFFGKRVGAVCGGLGMALSDLLSQWVVYAPASLVVVGLMGFVFAAIVRRKPTILNLIAATVIVLGIKLVGYYLFELLLTRSVLVPLASIPGNVMQIATGAIIAIPIILVSRAAMPRTSYKMMTPGPTMPASSVMEARNRWFGNPDVDEQFCEEYHQLCRSLGELLHTENEVYILGGEGILALESACASLTEPGDKVLVIDNGIFGKGFADFVKIYGGEPELYTVDYHHPVEIEALETFLLHNHDYKYATVVHCDTPSGVLNDISAICPLLKQYGILTVVDAVASMFGEEVRVDDWQIDIVCGGSQKALSAPPGLAFVSVSDDAMKAMEERKTPVASFYCNLLTFRHYYRDQWFPYTMPVSDLYGLAEAVRLVRADPERIDRHHKIAAAVRQAVREAGLSLYLESGDAATVTVVRVPEGLTDKAIIQTMKEQYGILIAGSFDRLAGKVFRLGHMGNNAREEDVAEMLAALTKTLNTLGFPCPCDMEEVFRREYSADGIN